MALNTYVPYYGAAIYSTVIIMISLFFALQLYSMLDMCANSDKKEKGYSTLLMDCTLYDIAYITVMLLIELLMLVKLVHMFVREWRKQRQEIEQLSTILIDTENIGRNSESVLPAHTCTMKHMSANFNIDKASDVATEQYSLQAS